MDRRLSGYAVFDLDGTLADSLGDITRALNRVLHRHGRNLLPESEVREWVGLGPRFLVGQAWQQTGSGVSDGQVARLSLEYLEEYRKNPQGGTRAFPGVEDGLRRLIQRGWKLALCTNKEGRAARRLVDSLGWRSYFGAVVSGEEGFRKPDPRALLLALQKLRAPRGRHLFIGDSRVDLETARNAGVEGIYLAHGYGVPGVNSRFGMRQFKDAVGLFAWMARS